jgi:hypothetical protein
MRRKLTLSEFISKSIKKHGNKYRYTCTNYISSLIKLKIECPIHGVFEQYPQSHLSGKGCSECGNNHKVTTKEFIERSNIIHNYKYDYSKSNYVNKHTEIEIICPHHGTFFRTPQSHLFKKCGCPKCKGRVTNIDEFIEKSKIIHGVDKYDYSLSIYKNNKSLIKLICKEHGVFEQIVNYHLSGCGCNLCGGTNKLTIDEFLEKSKKKHGDKYSYEKVDYINNFTKVEIFCKKHQYYFSQTPSSHFSGSGCPFCNDSKGEKIISDFLKNKSIIYFREYKFQSCKNILPLKFDFFLPDRNICIEYDGVQHFKPISIFGGDVAFEKLKINDEIKNNFCKSENINLIRISYLDDINEVLLQKIK